MVLRMFVAVICLTIPLAAIEGICFGQEAADSTPQNPKTPSPAAQAEIPIELLRKIVFGFAAIGEVKPDLSVDQIAAMKVIAASHANDDRKLGQVGAAITLSSFKNRRFTAAVDQIKAEREAALLKEWLAIITPEQQASLRRRNRQAMQSSLRRPQQQRPSMSLAVASNLPLLAREIDSTLE